jgi:hypothetical protein
MQENNTPENKTISPEQIDSTKDLDPLTKFLSLNYPNRITGLTKNTFLKDNELRFFVFDEEIITIPISEHSQIEAKTENENEQQNIDVTYQAMTINYFVSINSVTFEEISRIKLTDPFLDKSNTSANLFGYFMGTAYSKDCQKIIVYSDEELLLYNIPKNET